MAEVVRAAYTTAGAPENFQLETHPEVMDQVTAGMDRAVDAWLARHLQGPAVVEQ